MLRRVVLNQKWFTYYKFIQHGSKKFSEKHSFAVNDLISLYSNKKTRPSVNKKEYQFIVDSDIAESIACFISDDWTDRLVFEANPGPGVLSSHLLKKGLKLRVFVNNQEFLPALKALKADQPNLEIIENDLFLLPAFDSKLDIEPEHFESFFHDIPELEWIDDAPFRVFSIISNQRGIKFLRYLLVSLTRRSSIFAFGRCEIFVLTTEKEFKYMTAVPKENFSYYRWTTVLYDLFFEVKCLKKYSSDVLFPPKRFKQRKKDDSASNLYLVQLTPKKDIFSNKVNQNKLPELYFFVRHHLIKRTALVIPTLEGWVPQCGPRLIKDGMNVFTKFGDLSPNQILLLYNQFSSWPEYEDSAFVAAASRNLGQTHSTGEESVKDQEDMD